LGWGCVTIVYVFKDNFNLLKKFTTNILNVLDGCGKYNISENFKIFT